jgi:hypothetical protein
MKLIGEIFCLAALRFQVMRWNYLEEKKVKNLFYANPLFARSDRAMKRLYRFASPFSILKKFLGNRGGKDVYCYGETPLTLLDQMARECGLSSSDHFLELGSGRGRGMFFLSSFYGCKASGIDEVPEFVLKGYDLSKAFPSLRLSFFLGDMTELSLEKASVLYVYGTCLADETIERLADRMKSLPPSTKIITVSFPLTDYRPSCFTLLKTFTAEFNWGSTEIFIQSPCKNSL